MGSLSGAASHTIWSYTPVSSCLLSNWWRIALDWCSSAVQYLHSLSIFYNTDFNTRRVHTLVNANQLIQTEGQVTAWRLDLGVQDVVTAAIVKQRWLSFQFRPWRCCVCFTPTPLHWHHSMSRRRTIENTWHNAARGNRKAVFVHTQPELSCDGWTDGVDLV